MRVERPLRGLLGGLLLFLTATGATTVFVAEPGIGLQFGQLAHAAAGFLAVFALLAYVVAHVSETLGGVTVALRAAPLALKLLGALTAALVVASTFDLSGAQRMLVNRALGTAFALTCLFASILVVRALRWRKGGPVALGLLGLAVGLICAGTGVGVALGVRLYTPPAGSPWVVHVAASVMFVVLLAAHATPVRAERPDRAYSWAGAPAITFAATSLLCAAGWAWLGSMTIERPPVDARALRPMDVGFSTLAPATCERCHPEVTAGWESSPHALAANNPLFEAVLRAFMAAQGGELARYCLGCHAPHAADPRTATIDEVVQSAGFGAGVHCLTCHRSTPGKGHGDGDLTMTPLASDPSPILTDVPGVTERWPELVRDLAAHSLISSRVARHRRTYRFASREPESCVPCHVQTLSVPSQGVLSDVLQDHYGSWKDSEAAEADKDCKSCHAPRYVAASDYEVADHRFLGGSTWIAWVVGGTPAAEEVASALRGNGEPLLEIQVVRIDPERGPGRLRVSTRVTERLGHGFPIGPTDLFEIWLSARVTDSEGRTLLDVGRAGPAGAIRLGHGFEDAAGQPITDHRLWEVARVVDRGVVPARGQLDLELSLAEGAPGPLHVEAGWNYRRLDPALVEALTGLAPALPIVQVAQFEGTLP